MKDLIDLLQILYEFIYKSLINCTSRSFLIGYIAPRYRPLLTNKPKLSMSDLVEMKGDEYIENLSEYATLFEDHFKSCEYD